MGKFQKTTSEIINNKRALLVPEHDKLGAVRSWLDRLGAVIDAVAQSALLLPQQLQQDVAKMGETMQRECEIFTSALYCLEIEAGIAEDMKVKGPVHFPPKVQASGSGG